jgi:hypothetical protein
VRSIYGVVLSSVLVVTALAACDPATEPEAAATATSAASATAAAATTEAAAPADDAATEKACTELLKSVKDTTKQAAKGEKTGPPVGYLAVSTAYIAGQTGMIAYSIGASEPVSAAAKKVGDAMGELDKAWNANPKKAPSTAKLDAAVKELTTACAG